MINPTGEAVFGYSQAELLDRPFLRLLPDLGIHRSVRELRIQSEGRPLHVF